MASNCSSLVTEGGVVLRRLFDGELMQENTTFTPKYIVPVLNHQLDDAGWCWVVLGGASVRETNG